jgi:lysophospholipase L1-like esterase
VKEHEDTHAGDGSGLNDRLRAVSPGLLWFLRLAVLVVVPLALWLVVVEVGLRFVPVPGFTAADLQPVPPDADDLRNEPHPYLAYALRHGWQTKPGAERQASHNSLGFRGPETTWKKPEGVTRVVCLGGSSVYGHTETSDATCWPARLQVHLAEMVPDRKWEVINWGTSGYSTFEVLVNLAFRAVDLDPDLVIVYESINDMRCALYYWPDRPIRHDNTHWRAVWPDERASPIEPLLERSMTYRIFRRYCTDYFKRKADLGAYAMVGFEPDAKNYYTIPEPTKLGFQNSFRNLKSIVAVARTHGAKVLLCTQGNDDEDLKGRASEKNELEGLEQMVRIIRRVGEDLGVPVCDAAPVMEGEAARQRRETGDQTIFTHEVHLTDAGADLLARTIADCIVGGKVLE